jgi:hypothetical protein
MNEVGKWEREKGGGKNWGRRKWEVFKDINCCSGTCSCVLSMHFNLLMPANSPCYCKVAAPAGTELPANANGLLACVRVLVPIDRLSLPALSTDRLVTVCRYRPTDWPLLETSRLSWTRAKEPKGSDGGVYHSELLGFWTLSSVRNSKHWEHNVSETGSVSVLRWGEGDTYSVGSHRKS